MRNWPILQNIREPQSFLGLTICITSALDFATIASLFHQLTQKGQVFKWSEVCIQAFLLLLSVLVKAPVCSSNVISSLTPMLVVKILRQFCPKRGIKDSRSCPATATPSLDQRGYTASPGGNCHKSSPVFATLVRTCIVHGSCCLLTMPP